MTRTETISADGLAALRADFHRELCLLATVVGGVTQAEAAGDPEDLARAGIALRQVVERFARIREQLEQLDMAHPSDQQEAA